MKGRNLLLKFILYTFLAGCSLPLAILLIMAAAESWAYPGLLPEAPGLKYLGYVLGNRQTLDSIAQSILTAFLSTLLSLAIAIPAARALGLYRFKGREMIKMLVLLPLAVPAVTVTMGIHTAMIRVGLAGKLSGIVLIHTVFALPYSIRLLTDVFEILGETYDEQAVMLGAGMWYKFMNVTFPLLIPGIISASVMSFIVSFSQYITTFLIGGGRIVTLPVLMVPYIQNGQLQISSVYSLLFIFTAIISLYVIEKVLRLYYRDIKVY